MLLLDTYEQKVKYYYDKLLKKMLIFYLVAPWKRIFTILVSFQFDFTDFKLRQWSKKNLQARNKKKNNLTIIKQS